MGVKQERGLMVDTALILAGGPGTRLQPLVNDRPKALAVVAGRPFLAWMLEALQRQGVQRVHVSAGYRAEQIRDWLSTDPVPGLTTTLFAETARMGTGGAVLVNLPYLEEQPFLVLNGDSLLPHLSFEGLTEAHHASGRPATLTAVPIEQAGRYGTIEFDEQQSLTAFREKADHEQGWVNAGVYLFEHKLFTDLPPGTACSLERDLFPDWAARGLAAVHLANPPLLDMGTPEGLKAMDAYLGLRGSGFQPDH